MIAYSKDDYNAMARVRVSAFGAIAAQLGKEHAVTKMMGSLAWGRHAAEQGTQSTLRAAITEKAFLDGYFAALNLWARDHDQAAQRVMLAIYPRGMSTAGRLR